jgi:hypothetical protein
MDSKPKHIFAYDMKEQPDGRMKIILPDGSEITDLAMCCNLQEIECEDSIVYEIYFEKVKK